MRARGFTFIELLTTIGIVAVVAALIAPILKASRVAFAQQQAMFSLKQLSSTTSLYLADSDDTYPPGMNKQTDGATRTWFGLILPNNSVDTSKGTYTPYLGGIRLKDPTAPKLPFLGNGSGFGYNYETLGSDLSETRDFSRYPESENPASQSMLSAPGSVIAFATATFYRPKWCTGGDGMEYEFGFLTPPWAWAGNPTMSFRHQGERKVDNVSKTTMETGNALVLFADGSVKALRLATVTDKLFLRNPASFSAN